MGTKDDAANCVFGVANRKIAALEAELDTYLSFASRVAVAAEYGRDDTHKCYEMVVDALKKLHKDKQKAA